MLRTLASSLLLLTSVSTAGAQSSGCVAFPFNPWQLNVIVFGDIGSASNIRGSDFEGAAAALGNVWYQSFSVDWVATSSPTNIGHYVGGNMTFYSGSVNKGGLEIAGSLYLNSASVNGPVSVGGSMTTGSGGSTVTGNLLVAGSCTWCQSSGNTVSSGYTKTIGGKFTPTLSLARLQSYYQCIAQWAGSFADTTTYSNSYGTLTINLPAGTSRNYVTIPTSVLTSAYNINVYGTATQELIVNVPDTAATLNNWLTWSVSNGIPIGNVLVNMPNAVTLTIGSGGAVNLLAPFAVTTFNSGVTTGNFIVKQLIGGNGQINDGFYCTISFPLTCPNEACASSTTAATSPAATPSASPIASPVASPRASPAASISPIASPTASPTASPSASPSPSTGMCAALNTTYSAQYPAATVCGCSAAFVQTVLTTYNCAPISAGCSSYYCSTPIPQSMYAKLAQCLTA